MHKMKNDDIKTITKQLIKHQFRDLDQLMEYFLSKLD